ncbi:MAG: hypothetical protein AAGA48_11520 [Myxococcota bacterium]
MTLAAIAIFAALPLLAWALEPVPNEFQSGDRISSAAVNANYDYLVDAISQLEAHAIPTGALMYFNESNCPAGWSEVPEARGRTIVGLSGSAGTLAGTVGTAFGDLEDRGHVHDVNSPVGTTGGAGEHNHQWIASSGTGLLTFFDNTGAQIANQPSFPYAGGGTALGAFIDAENANHDFFTDESVDHDHSFDPAAATSSSADTSMVLPYIQYLLCSKDS